MLNKKVLLRERKRHTAHRVASARYAALSSGWGGVPHPRSGVGVPHPRVRGYPGQVLMVGGTPGLGVPHPRGVPWSGLDGGGVPHPKVGVPRPGLDGGTQVPPPSRPRQGVPWVPPPSRPGQGTSPRMGYPPSRPGWGTQPQTWDPTPDLGWGTPHHPYLDGVPPRPEMGYPPHHPDLDRVPPPTWDGVPPEMLTDRHLTDTFPRTLYAGGKDEGNNTIVTVSSYIPVWFG